MMGVNGFLPTMLAGKCYQLCLSIRLFPLWLLNRHLTLIFCMRMGHNHMLPEIESWVGVSKDSNTVGLTSIQHSLHQQQ